MSDFVCKSPDLVLFPWAYMVIVGSGHCCYYAYWIGYSAVIAQQWNQWRKRGMDVLKYWRVWLEECVNKYWERPSLHIAPFFCFPATVLCSWFWRPLDRTSNGPVMEAVIEKAIKRFLPNPLLPGSIGPIWICTSCLAGASSSASMGVGQSRVRGR